MTRRSRKTCIRQSVPASCSIWSTTLLAGTRGDEEITVGGGTWQLFANPVITAGHVTGAIIIFMDVTEREQREALRREFSANVSHELKTPLTSITALPS